MMSWPMAERQGPGLPGQDIFGLPRTGNLVADILIRISPEDGAVNGKLRDDWPDICIRAAEYVEARKSEILIKAALRYRNQLLGRPDGR